MRFAVIRRPVRPGGRMYQRVEKVVWAIALSPNVALVFFAWVASSPPVAMAQKKAWAQFLADGQQLQTQGRYPEAESSFQSAVEQSQAYSQPLATARSMNYLAVVKQIRGDYSAAEALYRSALEICERHPAPLDLAAIFLNQSRLYGAQGRFDQAEVLARRSLEIHRSQLGPDHPSVADTLDALGWIQLRLGRYREAQAAYQQSLAIRQKALPSDELDLAGTLNDLAFLQYSLGHYSEAEESY